jgi:hypothetical protein
MDQNGENEMGGTCRTSKSTAQLIHDLSENTKDETPWATYVPLFWGGVGIILRLCQCPYYIASNDTVSEE